MWYIYVTICYVNKGGRASYDKFNCLLCHRQWARYHFIAQICLVASWRVWMIACRWRFNNNGYMIKVIELYLKGKDSEFLPLTSGDWQLRGCMIRFGLIGFLNLCLLTYFVLLSYFVYVHGNVAYFITFMWRYKDRRYKFDTRTGA